MTAILGLTSTDKVRAIWGVTQSELPDSMLDALALGDSLTLELADLEIDYATIIAAGTAEGAPAEDVRKYLHLKNFAGHFCAVLATSSIRLAIPQKRGDGNNTYSRFQGDVLEATINDVNSGYVAARAAMLDALGLDAFVPATLVAATEPSYDPVAGE